MLEVCNRDRYEQKNFKFPLVNTVKAEQSHTSLWREQNWKEQSIPA